MKYTEEILPLLNQLLTNELTAINQYFIHSKMCENWGYERLAHKIREESIDEMRHADQIISRILFLEGLPNLQRYNKLRVGETVREQLESDLQLEYSAIAFLNQGILQGSGLILRGGQWSSTACNACFDLDTSSITMLRGDVMYYKENWLGSHEFQTGFLAMPRSIYRKNVH